ncbi:SMAD/FHA domain-containing protein [Sporodiniella umbellata]|nr:SMAD/FHA domain-containing protein [Sporodiniella umbellata]
MNIRIVPNIDNPSRSLIFDIVDRELEYGDKILVGRYSERHRVADCLSFKSKVVSRCHCEIWVDQDGKLYIRDTKSSSGTFLNHIRLSPAGQESRPVELHDGDILQLGVDFQGGQEEIYRSVKMKFELNRPRQRPASFSIAAFQNLRSRTEEDECCICLYALAPLQALFMAPCSHSYHFKCIRPLFDSYPGFQCPLCRTYSDLEANVASEEAPAPAEAPPKEEDSMEEDTGATDLGLASPSQSRERKTNHLLGKIKTALFEKRKSNGLSRNSKRQRPISFPHLMGESSMLTRQPTT